MLISLICAPLFLMVSGLIAILPSFDTTSSGVTGMVGMLSTAFQFFPSDVWILTLGSITFWFTINLIWGIVRFILRLIPVINMG